jgi:hypothetical protein
LACRRSAFATRRLDLLQQVEPAVGLPQVRVRLFRFGDVGQRARHSEHPAVVRHPVRRPGQHPVPALQRHVDHGNAVPEHLLGQDGLERGYVRLAGAPLDLRGAAPDQRLVRQADQLPEGLVGSPGPQLTVGEDDGNR